MAESLRLLRQLSATPAEAIRWACLLEATAPKVGNVYPGRGFDDLTHGDFVIAAEIAARNLTQSDAQMSARMRCAVEQTARTVGSNVNLGIVLLLGPLVAADEAGGSNRWSSAIGRFLVSLQDTDGANLYRAILAAAPGGLGSARSHDVRSTSGPVDILAAMKQAADRDRVARQYATGFADLLENILPIVVDSIDSAGDLLSGILRAQLRLLATEPDSLIARKCGLDFALRVRDRAAEININDFQQVERFDRWLRSDGHRRNPGTTADLIAASLYLILRSKHE